MKLLAIKLVSSLLADVLLFVLESLNNALYVALKLSLV